jgi:hypothetical protein
MENNFVNIKINFSDILTEMSLSQNEDDYVKIVNNFYSQIKSEIPIASTDGTTLKIDLIRNESKSSTKSSIALITGLTIVLTLTVGHYIDGDIIKNIVKVIYSNIKKFFGKENSVHLKFDSTGILREFEGKFIDEDTSKEIIKQTVNAIKELESNKKEETKIIDITPKIQN